MTVRRSLTLIVHTSEECLLLFIINTHVATQCAAVTTHRLLNRAPPHDNFFDRNPDLIMAALNAYKYVFCIYNVNKNKNIYFFVPATDGYQSLTHVLQQFYGSLHTALHNLLL